MLRKLRLLNDERGQSIVTIGLMSIFILGILGVVADTGFTWLQRRNLQNSADAAALAAAQKLPQDQAGANTLATDYVTKNGGGTTTVEFGDTIAGGLPTSVKVTVHKDSTSLFGVSLGFGNLDVNAKAKAKIRSQNLPGKGVVPIGVEWSKYQALTTGSNVVLKENKQDASSSNTGLIKLTGDTGDQIRDGLKWGSDVPLQPTLGPKPGATLGQATQNNNSGLPVRLTAAINYAQPGNSSKHCYTWAEVQPPSDPNALWACSPFNALVPDGSHFIQATAVILVPIIVENFTTLNGNPTLHVQPTAGGNAYLLAYFWVDGDATFKNPAAGDYKSNPANPKGEIIGRFMTGVPTQLSVFDPTNCRVSDGCGLVDYDPQAVIKVVQLVE